MLQGELCVPVGKGHEPSGPQRDEEEDGRGRDDVHQVDPPE